MLVNKKKLVIIILIFLSHIAFSEESISIYKLIQDTEAKLYWDSIGKKGLISTESHFLSFSPESNIAYLDYKNPVAVSFVYSTGKILMDSDTYDRLKNILVPQIKPKIATIIIDPGHGGKDPGTIGTHKLENGKKLILQEKTVVLKTAIILKRILSEKYPDKKIVLTRTNDTYISLEERTEKANAELKLLKEQESILFISIHVNASLNSKASGYEVWYLPEEYRRTVVEKDEVDTNQEEILPILNSMKEEELFTESVMLAKMIETGLTKSIGKYSQSRGLKEEKWFVVRNARMPAVLTEIGFASNKKEAELMAKDEYLQKVASGIYNGISEFIAHYEALNY
ncbi:N-acetylmuramoyl-L-alanine amidase [Spirochaetia bacterium 38H-sp]|uniref:N-acetylmuramoyl-L-alanine amidase n=1 Tax=Rarispira pelagica TaxID=3141764 RepID=A0ABU9UAL0_9SPIR